MTLAVSDSGREPEFKNRRMNKFRKFASLDLKIDKKPIKIQKLPEYKLSDHYDFLDNLGVGTYSYVKHAVDKLSGDHFAIKISRRTNSREMLKNEYNILKTIEHKNVVKVFDFIDNDLKDESYLVMEYFNGKSILELVEENTSFSESETKQTIVQLTEVISHLHSKGIAHRDIKPENVLVNDEKEVKVIDFNVSKVTLNADSSSDEPSKKFKSFYLTQISSPLYAAPELKTG